MKNSQQVSLRWIWMFVVPVGIALVIGYVYLRSENRALLASRAAEKAENDAMHGEIYRLRQSIDQQEATMNYLLRPDFERFLAFESDSSFCWLFYRPADSAWYAEVSSIAVLAEAQQYRLYTVDQNNKSTYIGGFERIADVVGLQKIGYGAKTQGVFITAAQRDAVPNSNEEKVLYRLAL